MSRAALSDPPASLVPPFGLEHQFPTKPCTSNENSKDSSADAIFSAPYGSPNAKGAIPIPEISKREEALNARMQPWYRIAIAGDEPFAKKGVLRHITVATKARQGYRANPFITGFMQYHLSGDALAEELRAGCASSTTGTYYYCWFHTELFLT